MSDMIPIKEVTHVQDAKPQAEKAASIQGCDSE